MNIWLQRSIIFLLVAGSLYYLVNLNKGYLEEEKKNVKNEEIESRNSLLLQQVQNKVNELQSQLKDIETRTKHEDDKAIEEFINEKIDDKIDEKIDEKFRNIAEKESKEEETKKDPGLNASQWARELKDKGKKVFSQNDEDGALEAVFDYVGTTDKVYVEFGVESCSECNTRYLREKKGWNVMESLLMDGGNENPDIRLEKTIFWPDNIIQLFKDFNVKKSFDLLSVDTDSYDFFMLEAILEAGYKPRVIIIEYNANFEITEAKSILPPEDGKSWLRWDASTYQGMSLLATQYLFNRFNYSLVYSNKVNCIGVADSELEQPVRLETEFFNRGRLDQHRCDREARAMAVIQPTGRWTGEDDQGQGSPHIRC